MTQQRRTFCAVINAKYPMRVQWSFLATQLRRLSAVPGKRFLNLREDVCAAVSKLGITELTPIQVRHILFSPLTFSPLQSPRFSKEMMSLLLRRQVLNFNSIIDIAGSGKTLSFVLPVVNKLKTEEDQKTGCGFLSFHLKLAAASQPNRPRAVIVVPSLELASQVMVQRP